MQPNSPSDYLVFIDESFDSPGFFDLSKDDAYFCYSALMVPRAKLDDLQRFWGAQRARLVQKYFEKTGFQISSETEFKSNFLNKIDTTTRADFAKRLAYFLNRNDCFIMSFYTQVRGLLLYYLRTEIAKDDNATELPLDWEAKLSKVIQTLLNDKKTMPGDSFILSGLFHQVVEVTLHWMEALKASFEVVYDSREKRENKFLFAFNDGILTKKELTLFRDSALYKGTKAADSAITPGLMLVDLIIRDVRFLFSDVPALLSESSSIQLIRNYPQADETIWTQIMGRRWKYGNRRVMSNELRETLRNATPNSTLPYYFHRFASQKISYYAEFGELRSLNLANLTFEDQLD